MRRFSINACAVPLLITSLAGCGSLHQTDSPAAGQPLSVQQESARQQSAIQAGTKRAEDRAVAAIEARTRAQLRAGTKIYYLPMVTVADGGHVRQYPANSLITRTANSTIVTPPLGPAETFGPHAQIIYLQRGGEVFVPPGRPTPMFLGNRAPNEITH